MITIDGCSNVWDQYFFMFYKKSLMFIKVAFFDSKYIYSLNHKLKLNLLKVTHSICCIQNTLYTAHASLQDGFIVFYSFIYTGAGHIIRISSKSWFISLIPFKKWNLYNVYIHSTQTDIFQAFIYFNFDDYNGQLMKTPNSVSQKIRILLKTNTKKGFLEILANWKVWTWKVWACTALNT